ncbi:hypothetical protein IEO21_09586 [Rhodonia placenta]|uniref:MYND-type domain-containing protein n=1 Tax=Rhodonia placenta TaxID=104341 RepID=A0A8H7NU77_9APHY|nr:hypothetical protein IEO21_09586 [Postia placenta]
MAAPKSHPATPICLPQSIFDDIGLNTIPNSASDVSLIYSKLFGGYRCGVLCGGSDPTCDVVPSHPNRSQDPTSRMDSFGVLGEGDHSSFLHLAVMMTDVPMAYECIRLGIMVNCQDARGRTPLLFTLVLVLDAMEAFWKPRRTSSCQYPPFPPGFLDDPVGQPRNRLWRLTRIVHVLLQQHADPNIKSAANETCLQLACEARQWELVDMLLQHGADPALQGSSNLMSLFSDSEVQEHLTELLAAHANPKRPERLCPCFSGKTLAQCHAARAQPYPVDFVCPCASGKQYGKCCLKRSALLSEGWSDEKQKLVVGGVWLSRATFDSRNIDPELCRVLDAFSDYVRRRRPDEAFIRARAAAELRHVGDIIDTLSREGLGDIAFIAVMKKLSPYIVMPYENTLSKVGCENATKAWNDSVDLYIETIPKSIDVRPRIEIEKIAKVANDGGPLYKRCEASGCLAVEGVDGAKMKICTGCKRILYCGSACQAADWSQHKAECKNGSHPLQMLPSQAEFRAQLDRLLRESLKKIQKMQNMEEAFRGDVSAAAGISLASTAHAMGIQQGFTSGADGVANLDRPCVLKV